MKPAGLILAAGESRRMGSPKALLQLDGETFLDRLIGILRAHADPVVVVLGADADRIRTALRRAGQATFVVNENWPQGQLSSMQCGLRALPAGVPGALFTLVDHPGVQPETVARLLAGSGALRIARYNGRRGHPVWWSAPLLAELLALDPAATARDVVERHSAEIEYVDVDDPGVLADIDEPADYRRLTGVRP